MSSGYKDRSYEDEYEAEKEDSETESNHNYNSSSKKYRDTENASSPTASEKRVNLNLNITKSPSKSTKVLKKVDLGAAANFGRDEAQSPTSIGGNDLLNDDFNPREGELRDTKTTPEFGDFEAAFGGTAQKKDEGDDFADFSSAFSQSQQPTPVSRTVQQSLLGAPPSVTPPNMLNVGGGFPNLMAGAPPQPNLFAANVAPQPNLFSPPPSAFVAQQNNANDLLGGLGSLSLQSPTNFASSPSAGQESLLDGLDSG